MDLRLLVADAQKMRPDLRRDGQVLQSLQRAAQVVARDSFAAREVVTVTLNAAATSLTPTLTAGRNMLKVMELRAQEDSPSTYFAPVPPIPWDEFQELRQDDTGEGLKGWSQSPAGVVYPYPIQTVNRPLKIECAYVPTGDFTIVDLPEQATEAVVALAESYLLVIPGKDQDQRMALKREKDARSVIARVRMLVTNGAVGGSKVAKVPRYPGAP